MQTFFLAPIGNQAGLTSVALGMLRTFERNGLRPGFFKPIEQPTSDAHDSSIHFVRELFHIEPQPSLTLSHVDSCLSRGEVDQIMEELISNYRQGTKDVDVVVVEGLTPDSERSFTANINAQIARNLSAEVIFVLHKSDVKTIAEQLEMAVQLFGGSSVKLAGYVVNKIQPNMDLRTFEQDIAKELRFSAAKHISLLGAIPFNEALTAPRMLDIARQLGAQVINHGRLVESRVKDVVIAARYGINMSDRFKPGAMIVAPGDRVDVILTAALMALRGVPLAGILLPCGAAPTAELSQLASAALQSDIPVLLSEHDTFKTTLLLASMNPHVPNDDFERMEGVVDFIAEHLNINNLLSKITAPTELRMPPPAFRFRLVEQARAANKRIVLPEGEEPRTVKAAAICHEKGIAHCVLLGDPDKIKEVAQIQGITLPDDIEIANPEEIRQHYIDPMVELRKHKGLNRPMAEQLLEDLVVLGTMMLANGDVDGLVSGAIHTTASTVRPALQLIKTADNASLVSSVFFMLMPDQVLVYGDCAINPDPSAEQLADIAIQSADSAAAFGIEPRVAMISYSTGSSGEGRDVDKVRLATTLAREKRPDLIIDGPMQYDAASVESVGKQKAPDSLVAGRATVFVFPDLNTGNTTYKAVQRSANVVSVGPMLQGLRKPVNDLSRGALVDDIVYTIAITAIQAEQKANLPK